MFLSTLRNKTAVQSFKDAEVYNSQRRRNTSTLFEQFLPTSRLKHNFYYNHGLPGCHVLDAARLLRGCSRDLQSHQQCHQCLLSLSRGTQQVCSNFCVSPLVPWNCDQCSLPNPLCPRKQHNSQTRLVETFCLPIGSSALLSSCTSCPHHRLPHH